MKTRILYVIFTLCGFLTVGALANADSTKFGRDDLQRLLSRIEFDEKLFQAAVLLEGQLEKMRKENLAKGVPAQKITQLLINFLASDLHELSPMIASAKEDPQLAKAYTTGLIAKSKRAQDAELDRTFLEDVFHPQGIIGPDFIKGSEFSEAQRSKMEEAYRENGGYITKTGSDLFETLQRTVFNEETPDDPDLNTRFEIVYSNRPIGLKIYASSELDYRARERFPGIILEKGVRFIQSVGVLAVKLYLPDLSTLTKEEEANRVKQMEDLIVLVLKSNGLDARIDQQRAAEQESYARLWHSRGNPSKRVFRNWSTLVVPKTLWVGFDFIKKMPDKTWLDYASGQRADKEATTARLDHALTQLHQILQTPNCESYLIN